MRSDSSNCPDLAIQLVYSGIFTTGEMSFYDAALCSAIFRGNVITCVKKPPQPSVYGETPTRERVTIGSRWRHHETTRFVLDRFACVALQFGIRASKGSPDKITVD